MRTYSAPLVEQNGFSLVEVWDTDAAGASVLVGYTILDSEGNPVAPIGSYDDALAEFDRLTNDNDRSPGLGM